MLRGVDRFRSVGLAAVDLGLQGVSQETKGEQTQTEGVVPRCSAHRFHTWTLLLLNPLVAGEWLRPPGICGDAGTGSLVDLHRVSFGSRISLYTRVGSTPNPWGLVGGGWVPHSHVSLMSQGVSQAHAETTKTLSLSLSHLG